MGGLINRRSEYGDKSQLGCVNICDWVSTDNWFQLGFINGIDNPGKNGLQIGLLNFHSTYKMDNDEIYRGKGFTQTIPSPLVGGSPLKASLGWTISVGIAGLIAYY